MHLVQVHVLKQAHICTLMLVKTLSMVKIFWGHGILVQDFEGPSPRIFYRDEEELS